MDLIDIDRLGCQCIRTVLYKFIVIPDVIIRIVNYRCIVGSCLEMPCKRIALFIDPVVGTDHPVLISVPLLRIRNLGARSAEEIITSRVGEASLLEDYADTNENTSRRSPDSITLPFEKDKEV